MDTEATYLTFLLSVICFTIYSIVAHETILHPLLHKHKHGDSLHYNNKIQKSLLKIVTSEQIHISFGEKMNDIVVVWASKSQMHDPYVEYGKDADLRKSVAETVQFTEFNGQGTKYWQRSYLSDLKDGEKYFYRVNSARGVGLASDQLSFTVPSLNKSIIHTVMILADMGISSKSLDFLVQEAVNGGYETVIHIGDIAYDLHRGEGTVGDKYLQKIQKMAAQIPYMTVPGDHELFKHYLHYRYRFSMPGSPWPMAANKQWYSYDVGNAHFIVINTEAFVRDTDLKSSQLSWLKNELIRVSNEARPKYPWVIVLGHRPMYSSCIETDKSCTEPMLSIRRELEDLFYKYGVDLYIAGHQHNYERTWPVYKGKPFTTYNYKYPRAPIHITIGSMGVEYIEEKFSESPPLWSAFRYVGERKELFGKLDIINATHLHWEVFCASNNKRFDHVWFIQNTHGTFGIPGEQAFKRSMELEKIPIHAPLGNEYSKQSLSQKTLLVSKRDSLNNITSIISLCGALCMLLVLGKFRKRLLAVCKPNAGSL